MSDALAEHSTWSDDDLVAVLRERSAGAADHARRCSALATLFRRYHARVFHQCRRLLDSDEAAEDLSQQIFVEMLEAPPRYEASRRFHAWLYVVVRNRCLNVIRRTRREAGAEEVDEVLSRLVDSGDIVAETERSDLARLLDELCAEELNDRERKVLQLRYGMQMRVKQINELLELDNTSGARTHLSTAKRKLRAALRRRTGVRDIRDLLRED